MTEFTLDNNLNNTSHLIEIKSNIQIRIVDDERFFWLMLIPQIDGLKEWHQIPHDTMFAMHEMMLEISRHLETRLAPDKINIGALGNMVPQFHLHLVLRYKGDEAWPGPVWGSGKPVALQPDERQKRMALIQSILTTIP